MATVVNFGGKKIIEPGVYALVKSGIPAAPSANSFGNVCIIDTGSGKLFGGGSGISGKISNGIESVYEFEDAMDFQEFVRGGLLWDVADLIFNPTTEGQGPEKVFIVRAAETNPAEITFNFVGGGTNGGSVKFLTKNEGEGANGYLDEKLAKGKIIITTAPTIGDKIDISVNDGVNTISITNGDVEAVTTSQADIRALIIDAINTESDYEAYEQAGEIILVCKRGTGIGGNSFIISDNITGSTLAVSLVQFSGGVDGTMLSTGYAAQMSVGDEDPNKFKIEFLEGTYRGKSPGGEHYSGLSEVNSLPRLIATSVEFDNIDDLIQWSKNDYNFSKRFILDPNWIINGTGAVDSADLVTYTDLNVAVNGSENYNGTELDNVLKTIRELDNTFFLCDRWGDEAIGVENSKILAHIMNDAEMDKFMIVGGGIDETKFDSGINSSISIAKFYDSPRVTVVHSGHKKYNSAGTSFERMPAFYHAANVAGRLGGLEPQVPATFKNLKITEYLHNMNLKEREKALQGGVLHNRNVPGIGSVINQAINTLQRNTHLINPDGTSFEISVMRIGAQLNKELILNLRPMFIGHNSGTASPEDVKLAVERLLLSRTATDLTDNLILSFKNVKVRLIEDYYDISYGFVPNGPINKMFITGFMLDANLSA